jgi:hypothetical protein
MVPPSILEVSIFVSNYRIAKPETQGSGSVPAPMSRSQDESGMLLPPTPYFAREGRRKQQGSTDDDVSESDVSTASLVDLSYSLPPNVTEDAEDLGHEQHILDLTNFDGDNDAKIPGEAQLSYRVRKEGKLRRARTRKLQAMAAKQQQDGGIRPLPQLPGAILEESTSRPGSPPGGATYVTSSPFADDDRHQRTGSDEATMPLIHSPTPTAHERPKPTHYLSEPARVGGGSRPGTPVGSRPSSPTRSFSEQPGGRHMRSLSEDAMPGRHSRPASLYGDYASSVHGLQIEIEDREADDLNIVSEMARPGKPKFEAILAEEVERARGSIAVGCK